MPSLREMIAGPWRAVSVLGVTQILAWGAHLLSAGADRAADRRRARLVAVLRDGRLLARPADRRPGLAVRRPLDRPLRRPWRDDGRLAASARSDLSASPTPAHPAAYLAVWMVLGVGLAASLYDPAFATLGRIFGAAARRADHGAHARRRLRLDSELAGDASVCSTRSAGAAPISSMPRCWRLSRAAACLRAAAQPRRGGRRD